MEENKLIESKKILTDYMLELNRDIQSAEEWANTGADEEMYFSLQTVLNELERLQKENKELRKELNEENKRCMMLAIERQDYFEKYQYNLKQNESLTRELFEKLSSENKNKVIEMCHLLYKNYIPKQKVEEKIEELKENTSTAQGEELLIFDSKLDVLKELLGE